MRFLLAIIFISLFCFETESKRLNSTVSTGLKITVCMNKGKCNYYGPSGLQQAVLDAIPGMTIEIYAGAYTGAVIDKPLQIIGLNRQWPGAPEDDATILNKREIKKKKKSTKGKNASGTKTNTFPIDLCPAYSAVTINAGITLVGTGTPYDGYVAGFVILRTGSGSTFQNLEILGQSIWGPGNFIVGIFGQTCTVNQCNSYSSPQGFGSVVNVGIQCVQFQQIFQGIHFQSAESIYIYENIFNLVAPTTITGTAIMFGIRIGSYESGLKTAISAGNAFQKTWIMNSNNEIDHNFIIIQTENNVLTSGIVLPLFGSNFEITNNVIECVGCNQNSQPSYGIGIECLTDPVFLSFTYIRQNKISAFSYGILDSGAGDMISRNIIQQSALYGVYFQCNSPSYLGARLDYNTIQYSQEIGIYIALNCNDIMITGNDVVGSGTCDLKNLSFEVVRYSNNFQTGCCAVTPGCY